MQILWRLKRAFVKEILVEMDDPKPPITTVSSIVRKLENENLVAFEAFGKTHRYYPVLTEAEYKRNTFKHLLTDYFEGSAEKLLTFFVKEEKIHPDELSELLEKIKNKNNDR